jgi:hypothetical protein
VVVVVAVDALRYPFVRITSMPEMYLDSKFSANPSRLLHDKSAQVLKNDIIWCCPLLTTFFVIQPANH